MTTNFDHVFDRRASGSIKWKAYPEDVLPMWVADMDFAVPPAISAALARRLEHPIFGYEWPSAKLHGVVVDWLARRYGWQVKAEDIMFLPGLVSGTNLVMRAFGHAGDEALCWTPSYPPFLGAPANNGMQLKTVTLAESAKGHEARYDLDFDAFERAFTGRSRVYIHCHPHNPTGREYTRDEMARLGELCLKNNVVILSDEIHCDLMLDGRPHLPMAMVSPEIAQNTVTLMAPSKTFNVPGLGCAFAVVQNPVLRKRMHNAEMGIVPHVNVLGQVACEAAFSECDAWLDDLLVYLAANRDAAAAYLTQHLPEVRFTVPEATYLMFLDFRNVAAQGNIYKLLLEKGRLALNDGATFGAPVTPTASDPNPSPRYGRYARINLGCTRATLMDGLARMVKALRA
ncbi:MAG: PatB family C-S lyase [Thermoflexales bacterium]|nr:PatB family C-S lyase [Thermoflexales bacterium]